MSVDILRAYCDQCWSTVQCCFTSTETIKLIRTESPERLPRLSHSSWTPRPSPHPPVAHIPYISGTFGDTGVHRHKTEPIFIADRTQSLDLETDSTFKHTHTHIYIYKYSRRLSLSVCLSACLSVCLSPPPLPPLSLSFFLILIEFVTFFFFLSAIFV